jgi:hypothetical protein
MRPRGNNNYHKKRMALFSSSGRAAVSVWNQGRWRTEPNPWLVFHDGVEREEMIEEIPQPFPDRPDLRIGFVDISAMSV